MCDNDQHKKSFFLPVRVHLILNISYQVSVLFFQFIDSLQHSSSFFSNCSTSRLQYNSLDFLDDDKRNEENRNIVKKNSNWNCSDSWEKKLTGYRPFSVSDFLLSIFEEFFNPYFWTVLRIIFRSTLWQCVLIKDWLSNYFSSYRIFDFQNKKYNQWNESVNIEYTM